MREEFSMKINMNKRLLLSMVILTLFISNCKTPFTTNLRADFARNDIKLNKIQFYNSERIVLERVITKQQKNTTTNGQVIYRNGKLIEYVIIPVNTPGICINAKDETLYVSFESSDDLFLPFLLRRNAYRLEVWGEEVEYNKNKYKVTAGRNAVLVIDKKDWDFVSRDYKFLKGRKVK
jgi:hypothetical protein